MWPCHVAMRHAVRVHNKKPQQHGAWLPCGSAVQGGSPQAPPGPHAAWRASTCTAPQPPPPARIVEYPRLASHAMLHFAAAACQQRPSSSCEHQDTRTLMHVAADAYHASPHLPFPLWLVPYHLVVVIRHQEASGTHRDVVVPVDDLCEVLDHLTHHPLLQVGRAPRQGLWTQATKVQGAASTQTRC